MLSFGVVTQAVLLVLAIVWCHQMLGRWRSDLQELRSRADSNEKGVIVILWSVTACVLVFAVSSVGGIASRFGHG